MAGDDASPSDNDPGRTRDRCGAWRLDARLGSGGMGEVWAATRVEGRSAQRGALKRMRDFAPTGEALARFERERQVLASLEDPAIARLIDGGVDVDGRPFLVMEFVEGAAIDVWCREHPCSVRERVELMVQVARAVDAAHTARIVHRDLKPSNVLVDTGGRVRLIDFGVAKVLDPSKDAALVTRDVARYLTPQFASPEQFRGESPTPASDVYALGAVLYGLLAGAPPLDIAGLGAAEAVRQVTEDLPAAPSESAAASASRDAHVAAERKTTARQIGREIGRDLDTIVLRCLRKEPARRYARAGALADDLERWLAGEPVRARRDTAAYRVRRFVRRHRVVVALTALAFALLSGSLWIALAQGAELERQSAQLSARSERTEQLLFDLRRAVDGITGSHYRDLAAVPGTERVMARLTRTLAAVASAQDDPDLLTSAVRAYWLHSVNVWEPFHVDAGRPEDAVRAMMKARTIGLELLQREGASAHAYATTSEVMGLSSELLLDTGQFDRAFAQVASDEEWLASLVFPVGERAHWVPPDRVPLSWIETRYCRAQLLGRTGRRNEALALTLETLAAIEPFVFDDPISASMLTYDKARLRRAAQQDQILLGLPPMELVASAGTGPHESQLQDLDDARAHTARGAVSALLQRGDLDGARTYLQRQLDRLTANGSAAEARSPELGWTHHQFAVVERQAGRVHEARSHAATAVLELERCVEGRPVAWVEAIGILEVRLLLGAATADAGARGEAEAILGRVRDESEARLREVADDWTARLILVDAYCCLARLQNTGAARANLAKLADAALGTEWTDAPDSVEVRERRAAIDALR